ncbi:hypothetical protein ACTXJ5_08455 [Psychrobacter alimentarius]|uniref:hypothetical protein n=1 Tax=Psychrobacter alimentarius TaxID=261164 RepID=UPI003FD204E9
MKHNLSITQQINNYVRSQQQLMKSTDIKKADHPNQEVSAFNNQVNKLMKTYQLNQLTQGVNQYE